MLYVWGFGAFYLIRFSFFFFFYRFNKTMAEAFESGLSQSSLMLHFRHFFIIFLYFFQIIKYLQNTIKSNKNLKITIILSINPVQRYRKNSIF